MALCAVSQGKTPALYADLMLARWISVLIGLGLAGGTAAFVSWTTRPQSIPELQLAPPTEACDPTPAFQILESPYDSIYPTPEGWTWKAQGYIGMQPCQGGILTISGYGVEAGGDWPLLIASLDMEGLGNWKFDQKRDLTVDVPHGGRLTLAFMNAFYGRDDQGVILQRQLYLERVRFTPRP